MSAGLLRFFEEETQGVQVKPELVVILTVALIVACILAHLQSLRLLPLP